MLSAIVETHGGARSLEYSTPPDLELTTGAMMAAMNLLERES